MYLPSQVPVEEMSLSEARRGLCARAMGSTAACRSGCGAVCRFGRRVMALEDAEATGEASPREQRKQLPVPEQTKRAETPTRQQAAPVKTARRERPREEKWRYQAGLAIRRQGRVDMARSLMAAGMEMDKAIPGRRGMHPGTPITGRREKRTRSGNSMGMKHILRALDQALETAEVERKYLRDELEAERVEKQRLAAKLEQLRGQAEEPRAELDKLLATFRAREREWAGIREDMAGKLRGLHKDKVRLKRTVDSLERENGKLREALEKWKN